MTSNFQKCELNVEGKVEDASFIATWFYFSTIQGIKVARLGAMTQ